MFGREIFVSTSDHWQSVAMQKAEPDRKLSGAQGNDIWVSRHSNNVQNRESRAQNLDYRENVLVFWTDSDDFVAGDIVPASKAEAMLDLPLSDWMEFCQV